MKLRTKHITTELDIGDGGFITVREILPEEAISIMKPYREIVNDKGTGKNLSEKLSSLKDDKDSSSVMNLSNCFPELFKLMVVDWRGIDDESGEKLPCNDATKNLVCEHDKNFVIGFVPVAMEAISNKKDEIAKNCGPGASGTLSQGGSLANTANVTEDLSIVMNAQNQDTSSQKTH